MNYFAVCADTRVGSDAGWMPQQLSWATQQMTTAWQYLRKSVAGMPLDPDTPISHNGELPRRRGRSIGATAPQPLGASCPGSLKASSPCTPRCRSCCSHSISMIHCSSPSPIWMRCGWMRKHLEISKAAEQQQMRDCGCKLPHCRAVMWIGDKKQK